MYSLFKECPHPDDKQRMKLSQELGLKPRQVKFWFQNRRTQMKVITFYHSLSLLRLLLFLSFYVCVKTLKYACCQALITHEQLASQRDSLKDTDLWLHLLYVDILSKKKKKRRKTLVGVAISTSQYTEGESNLINFGFVIEFGV